MDSYVFCSESGEIYSSPNRLVPPREIPPPTNRISLLQTRSIQWSCEEHPFLAWAPANVKFAGPILGRLACTHRSVPLRFVNGRWRLDANLEIKWTQLEKVLTGLVEYLAEPDPNWKSYRWPWSFGYREAYLW